MEFYINGNELDEKTLLEFIAKHRATRERYDKLDRYYRGEHEIIYRARQGEWSPNNRLVCNFAKYITDTAVGYAFGNPVRLTFENNKSQEIMDRALFEIDAHTHDSELAKDLSVFGNAYELIYTDAGSDDIKARLAIIDPRCAFVIYDDSVCEKPAYGVVYGKRAKGPESENDRFLTGYDDVVKVYGENKKTEYENAGGRLVKKSEEEHYLGGVPLIEYWNNEEGMGDFEHVLSLIDAYNTLQSDRLNDKERFVDSVLLIRGCQFPDDESASKMLTNRILELPFDGADARYLTKTMNETEIEILRRAISEDIHKFSQTPDFSDERFSGNSTGVAIKYKLLSIENLAKVKERFFISGLKERVKFIVRILTLTGAARENVKLTNVNFNRSLPINEYELAQTIATLHGIVPDDELLSKWV